MGVLLLNTKKGRDVQESNSGCEGKNPDPLAVVILTAFRYKKESCSLSKNCPILRDYEKEGGTCLRGKSDIYVHCGMKKQNQKKKLPEIGQNLPGEWTEWDTPIPCFGNQPFTQTLRTCKSTDKSGERAFCRGRWLKPNKCKNKIKENENYNLYANYEYDYSSYSQSKRSVKSASNSKKCTFRNKILKRNRKN